LSTELKSVLLSLLLAQAPAFLALRRRLDCAPADLFAALADTARRRRGRRRLAPESPPPTAAAAAARSDGGGGASLGQARPGATRDTVRGEGDEGCSRSLTVRGEGGLGVCPDAAGEVEELEEEEEEEEDRELRVWVLGRVDELVQ
jgi:hypothetical protein